MATKKKIPDAAREYLASIGKKGGKAKTTKPKGPAALSPERRKEIARAAAAARWGNKKK